MNDQVVNTSNADKREYGWLTRKLAGFYATRDAVKQHPLWGTLFAFMVAVLGVATNELYAYVKSKVEGPDAFLVQIRDEQKAQFATIEKYLGQIRSGMSQTNGASLGKLRVAVNALESSNVRLINQLRLAKQENEKLSRISAKQGGPAGGYDFLLSGRQGIRVDAKNVFGVSYIGGGKVSVSLSSANADGTQKAMLDSGQSMANTSADGRPCKITLLSFDNDTQAASFARICSSHHKAG